MPATIFSGSVVKALLKKFSLNGGAEIHSSTTDPTSVAVSAPIGSLLLNESTGALYRKLDAGSSTNWTQVGSGGSTSSVTKSINQTSHGFSVGNVLYYTGSQYAKAQANSDSTSEVVGIVSAVADANNFTLAMVGYVSGLSGFTAGTTYYLDASTAGALTSTEPLTTGYISKPVLIADSTTSGYLIESRGIQNAAGVSLPIGDWTQYTPTYSGMTASSSDMWWRRYGDTLEVLGRFTLSSTAASEARVGLPNGLVIDGTKVSSIRAVGNFGRGNGDGGASTTIDFNALAEPNVSYFTIGVFSSSSGFLTKQNGSSVFSASDNVTFRASVPISGWSSGGGTSPILSLSDWQDYTLTINASTSNPSLGTTSINKARWRRVGDSMEIQYDLRQTSAGSAGTGVYQFPLPSGYTIDSNKVVVDTVHGSIVGPFKFSNASGADSSQTSVGSVFAYSTTKLGAWWQSGETNQLLQSGTGDLSNTNVHYKFTARVPISGWTSISASTLTAPRSQITVDSGNGHGSTATKRRRFTNTRVSTGSAITYTDSASNAAQFTINETGVYAIEYHDARSDSAATVGIIVNDTANTTNPTSGMTFAQGLRAAMDGVQTATVAAVSWTGNLNAGDIVSFGDNGGNDATNTRCMATITKVSN
jgi:hypothetical protein